MRARIVAFTLCLSLGVACKGNSEEEGRLAAQKAAEEEAKRQAPGSQAAPKIHAPVQGSRKVECSQLINLPLFREALEEKEPLSMRDTRKSSAEASAACSLLRGGRMLTPREQEAIIKRNGKLGVLPGDELCNIAAFCSVNADEESLRKRCTGAGKSHHDAMGSYACATTVQHGAVDVVSLRFVDSDTHCMMEVRGGPSMSDNDFIVRCAKAARDLIGPPEIAEQPATPAGTEGGQAPPEPAPADGSAGAAN